VHLTKRTLQVLLLAVGIITTNFFVAGKITAASFVVGGPQIFAPPTISHKYRSNHQINFTQ
jgi:hypothetical protein